MAQEKQRTAHQLLECINKFLKAEPTDPNWSTLREKAIKCQEDLDNLFNKTEELTGELARMYFMVVRGCPEHVVG